MTGVRVYVRHARAARLDHRGANCAGGIRAWCELHNVDLREFLTHGLPVADVDAIGTAFALRMAELARAEAAGGASDGQE